MIYLYLDEIGDLGFNFENKKRVRLLGSLRRNSYQPDGWEHSRQPKTVLPLVYILCVCLRLCQHTRSRDGQFN